MRALEQRPAASVTSLPTVTAPSGKQAVIEIPLVAKAAGGAAQRLKLEVQMSEEANGHTMTFTLAVTRDGKRVLEKQGTVWDGQTLMFGGLEPGIAAAKPGVKAPHMVLFLTPTLVDDTGKRIHTTSSELPFSPTAPSPSPRK